MRRAWAFAASLLLAACTGAPAAPTTGTVGIPDLRPRPSPSDPAVAVAAPGWWPTEAGYAAALTTASALTLEQLAGQLIIARHRSEEESIALVRNKHFGGVMVTGDRILDVTTDDPLADVTRFNTELRELGRQRGVPVVVPIDQEGGLVARLRTPLTEFPTFMSAGAAIAGAGDAGAAAVTAAAQASGAELRAAGFNFVFAPVADMTVGPDDPIIGSRSPSSYPEVAGKAVAAALDGYAKAGILASVKHFPGHNVTSDSHVTLPQLASDRDRLRTHDIAPFRTAIERGAPSIMTGHLDVPAVDRGVPASASRKMVTDLLRTEIGFGGLIVSDSLGMASIMERHPGGAAAVAVLKAGSDLALMPADNDAAHAAVLAALRSGDLPVAQARLSAARVIAWIRLVEEAPALPGTPGSHAAESQALSATALTRVAGTCTAEALSSVSPQGDEALVAAFTEAADDAGLGVDGGPSVVLLGEGDGPGWGDIVVATDRPWVLSDGGGATRYALYGSGVPAMRALVDVLIGRAEPRGASAVAELTVQPCTAA